MQTSNRPLAVYQGSENTPEIVRRQIFDRWGVEEANKYHPLENCFTYNTWRAKGFQVKKGEKCLESYTYIKKTEVNAKGESVTVASYPKKVCLFYYLQVERIKE